MLTFTIYHPPPTRGAPSTHTHTHTHPPQSAQTIKCHAVFYGFSVYLDQCRACTLLFIPPTPVKRVWRILWTNPFTIRNCSHTAISAMLSFILAWCIAGTVQYDMCRADCKCAFIMSLCILLNHVNFTRLCVVVHDLETSSGCPTIHIFYWISQQKSANLKVCDASTINISMKAFLKIRGISKQDPIMVFRKSHSACRDGWGHLSEEPSFRKLSLLVFE